MKIRPEEIERIIRRLLREWMESHQVTLKISEAELKTHLIDIFSKEIHVEDLLNEEVERMLQKYEKEIEKGTIDRRKMFNMIKNQLVKERRIVL